MALLALRRRTFGLFRRTSVRDEARGKSVNGSDRGIGEHVRGSRRLLLTAPFIFDSLVRRAEALPLSECAKDKPIEKVSNTKQILMIEIGQVILHAALATPSPALNPACRFRREWMIPLLIFFGGSFLVAGSEPSPEARLRPRTRGESLVVSSEGQLQSFAYTAQGDHLPDFSMVGYRRGEVPLPVVEQWKSLAPADGDDTARIQAAIDELAAEPLRADGFRGALVLRAGEYQISGTLRLTASGLVLRGEQRNGENLTTIRATTTESHSVLIAVEGSGDRTEIEESRTTVLDSYVPVGASCLRVASPENFRVGDRILVTRPGSVEWIHELGMDRIPPHPDGRRIEQWNPETYTFRWDREILAIEADTIILDAPITQALDRKFGESSVVKYRFPGRIWNVGVECLDLVSNFDRSVVEDQKIGDLIVPSVWIDEDHAWTGIKLTKAEHCWVEGVSSRYFAFGCVWAGRETRCITVANCVCLDPVSQITGGRRYSFNLGGELALVRQCRARGGRHDFALDSRVCGPNVFYDCHSREAYATSEPHHRFATGALYDNVTVDGPYAWMMAINRSFAGSGHGWSGGQIVFWNCGAPLIAVQKPPTAENFIFGYRDIASSHTVAVRRSALEEIAFFSGLDLEIEGGTWGDGWIHSPASPVEPESLFRAQLAARRRGPGPVEASPEPSDLPDENAR